MFDGCHDAIVYNSDDMNCEMDKETASFDLVQAMQEELRNALNSLGGKTSNGLLDRFVFLLAKHINSAADGYICLRKASKIDASKHLIRPSIEAALQIVAVRNKPELLYRFAHNERTQNRRLYEPQAIKLGEDYDIQDKKRWEDFTREYKAFFPAHDLLEQDISMFAAAKAAGLDWYYDVYYRLYCRFTHALLAATSGSLNWTDPEDNPQMAVAICCAVEAVQAAGGAAPNLVALRSRLDNLGTGGTEGQRSQ